ncbi:hypothetical protein AVEN_249462-1, partial [Araneus ventricosus]
SDGRVAVPEAVLRPQVHPHAHRHHRIRTRLHAGQARSLLGDPGGRRWISQASFICLRHLVPICLHARPLGARQTSGVHLPRGLPLAEQAACGAGRGGDDGQHQQDPAGEHPAGARRPALPLQQQADRGGASDVKLRTHAQEPKETCLPTLVSFEEDYCFAKMVRYSIEDRVFLFKTFYLCDQRPAETLRKRSSVFKNRTKPSSSMLKALIAKFERTGSVSDDKVAMKTKQKTARTHEKITATKTIMDENHRRVETSYNKCNKVGSNRPNQAGYREFRAETSFHYLLRWQTF